MSALARESIPDMTCSPDKEKGGVSFVLRARGLASGDEGCANGYEDIVDIAGQRFH